MLFKTKVVCAALCALLACIHSHAQQIVLENGSSGSIQPSCRNQPPAEPRNLTARPRDGRIELSWQDPGDNACRSTFIVRVYNGTVWQRTPLQVFSSVGFNTTVNGLSNAMTYLLTVQSYSAAYKGGATAFILGSPTDKCAFVLPGKPENVHVEQAGDTWVQLCWDGVDNDACVDQFRVSVSPVAISSFRTSDDGLITHTTCANISDLTGGLQYQFLVLATNRAYGEGTQAGRTLAYVGTNETEAMQNGWTCRKVAGCQPDNKNCTALGCPVPASSGFCKNPAQQETDWSALTVTQWCAQSCPCDIPAALAEASLPLESSPSNPVASNPILAAVAAAISQAGFTAGTHSASLLLPSAASSSTAGAASASSPLASLVQSAFAKPGQAAVGGSGSSVAPALTPSISSSASGSSSSSSGSGIGVSSGGSSSQGGSGSVSGFVQSNDVGRQSSANSPSDQTFAAILMQSGVLQDTVSRVVKDVASTVTETVQNAVKSTIANNMVQVFSGKGL